LANNGKFGRSAAFLQDYHVVLVGLSATIVPDWIIIIA
jgi:hypothetical protein